MGAEESHLVDERTPPRVLDARTIDGVASYIKSGSVKRIVVMTGAGISTSAGIPDFRSPETGLYANLARLDLPYAEAVFDISYFREKPEPFYMLAHELYPGKYRPTITHCFIALLERKGLLHKLFTQNIDCLEREAGVSGDKIVEAHGSFATQRCIDCKTVFPADEMREIVMAKGVPHCKDSDCDGLVKPDIVFFGEQLPAAFFENRSAPEGADLAIVMGTSLTVQPFASLPGLVRERVPRVLINMEQVGSLGARPDDVLVLEKCDEGVKKLAAACGWLEELQEMWNATGAKFPDWDKDRKAKEDAKFSLDRAKSSESALQEEIDKLTEEVDGTLSISKAHQETVARNLEEKKARIRAEVEQTGDEKMPSAPLSNGLGHVFPHLNEGKEL